MRQLIRQLSVVALSAIALTSACGASEQRINPPDEKALPGESPTGLTKEVDTPPAENPAIEPDKTVELTFAQGESSATVSDTLVKFALHDYLVRASAGQTLQTRLSSDGPPLIVVIENEGYTPNAVKSLPFQVSEALTTGASDLGTSNGWVWQGTLPRDGVYRVRVAYSGPAANQGITSLYTLMVAINDEATTESAAETWLPSTVIGTFDKTQENCSKAMTMSRLTVSQDRIDFYYGYATLDAVAFQGEGYDVDAMFVQ